MSETEQSGVEYEVEQGSIEAEMEGNMEVNIEANLEANLERNGVAQSEMVGRVTSAVGASVDAIAEDSDDDLLFIDRIDNILDLAENEYPQFTLAKNKARFLRMLAWYKQKETWLDVAPISGVSRLFKTQSKELEGIRSNKLDYEMELETGTLTPSQRSYRRDELKMCKVHEKMAVHLIAKMQVKIKSGRR